MKKLNYHDLENLVNGMQLTDNEIKDVLDEKNFPSQRTGYTLPPGIFEIFDINKTLQYLLPDIVKVSITIDDIRLKSNINVNQTLIFTRRSFFCTKLGFSQSHSGPLGDIDGFIRLTAGTYESDRPINITSIDKVHSKCDCTDGIVNGIRGPILYSFGLSTPPAH